MDTSKEVESYSWPMTTTELSELIGVSKTTIRRHLSRNWKELAYGKDKDCWDNAVSYTNATDPRNVVWSKEGAIKIAVHCRSRKAGVFLENIGAMLRHRSSVESASLDIITAALKGITKCKRQFPFGQWAQYRIDLYLPELKIAIECDEEGHAGRDVWDEEFRQKEIEEKLCCRFIRFNPDQSNFNVGTVINEILSIIMSND